MKKKNKLWFSLLALPVALFIATPLMVSCSITGSTKNGSQNQNSSQSSASNSNTGNSSNNTPDSRSTKPVKSLHINRSATANSVAGSAEIRNYLQQFNFVTNAGNGTIPGETGIFTMPTTGNFVPLLLNEPTTLPNTWQVGNTTYSINWNLTFATTAGFFQGARIYASLTLPDYITTLGENTFQDASFNVPFSLPNSITEIPDNCFTNARFLQDFFLPNDLTAIGVDSFNNAIFAQTFSLPESLVSIEANSFFGVIFTDTFVLSANLQTIGLNAFSHAIFNDAINFSPQWTNIPNTVNNLDHGIFYQAIFGGGG